MTTISAKIIADSISPQDIRLTTMQLRYPKCIHSEFMTHRMFSRNASSSRAIPVERLIKDIMEDPYIPIHWGKNQRGMTANVECNELVNNPRAQLMLLTREESWLRARDNAVSMACAFAKAGYHKQIINRLIEPWCHINVVITATDWSNFFALRDHGDAMPEIQALAQAMKKAMAESTPKLLKPGQWHTPYVDHGYSENFPEGIKCSVARCARVSYLTQEGKEPSVKEDLALYERLVAGIPIHASPCEHQATPDIYDFGGPIGEMTEDWKKPQLHGNLRGWIQFRKTLKGECQ